MVRTSPDVAAETAQRILDAAARSFTESGFAAASLDDVAHRAGVTRGAVYHHYRSKRGLMHAVVAAAHARVAQEISARADAHITARDQLVAGSHAFLDVVVRADVAALLLIEAAAALGWQAWRELDDAASVAELRDALARVNNVASDDVDAIAQALSGAMNDLALWVVGRGTRSADLASAHRALDRVLSTIGA